MPIFGGLAEIGAITAGNQEIAEVYAGVQKVWPVGTNTGGLTMNVFYKDNPATWWADSVNARDNNYGTFKSSLQANQQSGIVGVYTQYHRPNFIPAGHHVIDWGFDIKADGGTEFGHSASLYDDTSLLESLYTVALAGNTRNTIQPGWANFQAFSEAGVTLNIDETEYNAVRDDTTFWQDPAVRINGNSTFGHQTPRIYNANLIAIYVPD